MIENVANAVAQQPSGKQHMTLEEFCGTIRRMESQGQDGVSLFNDVISQGYAPDLIAEDEFQHSRRLERITSEITRAHGACGRPVLLGQDYHVTLP